MTDPSPIDLLEYLLDRDIEKLELLRQRIANGAFDRVDDEIKFRLRQTTSSLYEAARRI